MAKNLKADNPHGSNQITLVSTFDENGKTLQTLMEELLKQALTKYNADR